MGCAVHYVYFVQSDFEPALIKIGTTINVQQRLKSLRSSSPNRLFVRKLIYGDSVYEGKLHRKFGHLRAHGEWFRCSPDINSFIDEVPEDEKLQDYRRWLNDDKGFASPPENRLLTLEEYEQSVKELKEQLESGVRLSVVDRLVAMGEINLYGII